ncbi:uncharacterized protein [Musca autumnalis]|uniref:uncharacterized protein n=1 Tax=Musca autumnalis TaxID=221902 RepID=UPI003CF70243
MRTVLTIFGVVVIMQVCIDAYNLRLKRSTYIEQNVQGLFQFAKNVVNASGPMINAVIEAMPDTDDYNDYRGELENYLRRLDDYRENSGMCVKKSIELMVSFMDVMMPYAEEEDEISPQAKEVLRLLRENGLLDLQNQAEIWMNSFDDAKLKEEYENLNESGINNMTSAWVQIC